MPADFGAVDIVIANAGVVGTGMTDSVDDEVFKDIVDINLRDVWNTIEATAEGHGQTGVCAEVEGQLDELTLVEPAT